MEQDFGVGSPLHVESTKPLYWLAIAAELSLQFAYTAS